MRTKRFDERRKALLAKVWRTFVTEMKPPATGKLGPVYYNPKYPYGCAIGCLLDKDARRSLAGRGLSIQQLFKEDPKAVKGLDAADSDFLQDLQNAHDNKFSNSKEPSQKRLREEALKKIAATYGLPAPV